MVIGVGIRLYVWYLVSVFVVRCRCWYFVLGSWVRGIWHWYWYRKWNVCFGLGLWYLDLFLVYSCVLVCCFALLVFGIGLGIAIRVGFGIQ